MYPPLQGEGRSPAQSEGERGGVMTANKITPTRLAALGDLPPPGGGGANNCVPTDSPTGCARSRAHGSQLRFENSA